MDRATTEHSLAYAVCVRRFGPPDGPETLPELLGADQVIERFWTVAAELGFARGGPVITGTRREIAEQLMGVARRSTPGGRTLLYWLGHGEDLGFGVTLPAADWDPDWATETSMDAGALHARLTKVRGDVLCVIDACHSGALARQLDDHLRTMEEAEARPVRSIGYVGTAAREERARVGVWLRCLEDLVRDRRATTRHGALWTPYTAALGAGELMEAVRHRVPEQERQESRLYGGEGLNRFFRNPYHDPRASAQSAALRGAAAELRQSRFPSLRHVSDSETFVGRHGPLRRAADWLAAPQGHPVLLVTGKPGCGKSAFLAQLVRFALETDGGPLHRAAGIPPRPRATVAAVALCRDAAALDVARRLAEDMELAPPDGAWRSPAQVLAAIGRETRGRAATAFVVDGLDEAAPGQAEVIAEEVLAPLAQLPGVQLVVGSRTLTRTALLPPAARAQVEDLDRDTERDADIAAYTRLRLAAPPSPYAASLPGGAARDDGSGAPGTPADGALRDRVVAAVAARCQGSFLAALLYSALLARLDRPYAETTPEFRSVLEAGLDDVFDQELADLDAAAGADGRRSGDRPGWARGLLLPLAAAQGAGLPEEDGIWLSAANALAARAGTGHRYRDDDIEWILHHAGAHIDIAGGSGQKVNRLYHKAWVGHLTAAAPGGPEQLHSVLTDVLLAAHDTAYAGRETTGPYIARHLADHAAAAGRLHELFDRPALLLRLDPERMSMLLDRPERPATPRTALYRRIADGLGRAGTPVRRATLLTATALRDDPALLGWARRGADLPWEDRWTTAEALGHSREWRAPRGDVLALAGTTVPEPALLGAGEQLWRWPLAGGGPELLRDNIAAEAGRAANRLHSLKVPVRPDSPVAAVAGDAGRLLVWPRDSGEVRVLGWGAGISDVAVGGDEDTEVVAAAGGFHVGVWTWTDGRPRHHRFRRWHLGRGTEPGVVSAVAVARLGDTLCVVAGGDGGCELWDVRTGGRLHVFGADSGTCQALAVVEHRPAAGPSWSPAGTADEPPAAPAAGAPAGTYVAGLFTGRPDIRVWRLPDDGSAPVPLPVPDGRRREPSGTAVALGHQGDDLMLAVLDGDAARIWNLSRGRELPRRPGHRSRPTSLAFLPDDSGAVAVADGVRVRVWDPPAAGSAPVRGDGLLSPSAKLFGALAPDAAGSPGSGAVALASGSRLRAWDLTGRRLYETDDLGEAGAVALHTDRGGRTWLAVGGRDGQGRSLARIRPLDGPRDAPWREFEAPRRGAVLPAVALAEDAAAGPGGGAGELWLFYADGRWIHRRGVRTGEESPGHWVANSRVGHLEVVQGPGGASLLAATAGDSLWLWPGLAPGGPRARLRLPKGSSARALAATRDGSGRTWLAVAVDEPVPHAPGTASHRSAVNAQPTRSTLLLGRPDDPDGLRALDGAPPRLNSLAFSTTGDGTPVLLAASLQADLTEITGWTVAPGGAETPARWEIPSRGYDVQSVLSARSPAGGLYLAAVGLDRMDLLHLTPTDRLTEAAHES